MIEESVQLLRTHWPEIITSPIARATRYVLDELESLKKSNDYHRKEIARLSGENARLRTQTCEASSPYEALEKRIDHLESFRGIHASRLDDAFKRINELESSLARIKEAL